jgi:hypothetical protein
LRISGESGTDSLKLRVLTNSDKEDSLVNLRPVLGDLLDEDVLDQLDLVVRNINLVSRSEVRNFSKSTLFLLLHHELHLFLGVFDFDIISTLILVKVLTFVVDLVSFLVTLFTNAVVIKVGLEFSESNELSVADVILTLLQVLSLELLVLLDF